MVDEINHILQKTIIPGGYGVIGGGSYFSPLFESLKSKNLFQNIVKTNELTSECGKDLQEFCKYNKQSIV